MSGFPSEAFKDLTDANAEYIKSFKYSELTGVAQKGLAIVTCMDSRINPLSVVGMRSGDAKILRNAGARVTEDVLRTLVLATYLLGVKRILVMPHTQCRMAENTEEEIMQRLMQNSVLIHRRLNSALQMINLVRSQKMSIAFVLTHYSMMEYQLAEQFTM